MLEIQNLSFSYRIGDRSIEVLKELNLAVERGEFVGIQGPSGSGKSTLFYILGFLLKPTSGKLFFDGFDITRLTEDQLTFLRNQRIGFVFQQFHLLARSSALENILLPTYYPSEFASPSHHDLEKAQNLARTLGITQQLSQLPNQLSGGQQQRVAIARALSRDVDWILADEPTGNLDSHNAEQTLSLLRNLNRAGKTIIMITHDEAIARFCSRTYLLKEGKISPLASGTGAKSAGAGHVSNYVSGNVSGFGLEPLPSSGGLWVKVHVARSIIPLAIQTLKKNLPRSLLTQLGILIGVAAVLVTITLGQFSKRQVLESYEALGVNKVLLYGYPNWNFNPSLPREGENAGDLGFFTQFQSFDPNQDFSSIQRNFPEVTLISPVLQALQASATAGGRSTSEGGQSSSKDLTIYGVSPEFLRITRRQLREGRNFHFSHIENQDGVCIIGSEIAHVLFQGASSLGETVFLTHGGNSKGYPCKVIGVLEPVRTNREGLAPNRQVLIPYSYFQVAAVNGWSGRIFHAAMQIHVGSNVEEVSNRIKKYLEEKYAGSGRFMVDQDSAMVSQMKRTFNLFTLVLTSIACVSLVVGGIGVNNMMLASVTERLREFGLRKALGATRLSIRMQVLAESLILCFGAGLGGIILGSVLNEAIIAVASRMTSQIHFEWVINPFAILLSFFSIVTVGIASGFVPAKRAERFQTIETLRAE